MLDSPKNELPILVKDHGSVRWIKFNRPEVHNAQNPRMLESLAEALEATRRNDAIRAVVLAGMGPSFCSGHDLRAISSDLDYSKNASTAEGRYKQEEDLYVRPVQLFQELPMPTVCRVQGHCLAAALMFVSVSDFVVAAEDAIFGSPVISALGVNDAEVPSFIWRVGERRAKQALWLNERFTAQEAAQMGLVNWVVPETNLDSKVDEVTSRLLQAPREALALSKSSFRFLAERQGERDFSRYHFMAHQLSHHTREAQLLLEDRVRRNEKR